MSSLEIEIKELRIEVRELTRLVRKLVRGEIKEPDLVLTSKEFLEKTKLTQRQMYHITDKYPELKVRRDGFGILINYTMYLKIKR
jgi:hypothetical protein